MTVREALSEGSGALEPHETETPRLDASLLLAHAAGLSREKLYMELAEPVAPDALGTYRRFIERRLSGEPVAWIVGAKEFWGLEFSVGPGVLCPRPDSETLVEAALEVMDGMTSHPAEGDRDPRTGEGPSPAGDSDPGAGGFGSPPGERNSRSGGKSPAADSCDSATGEDGPRPDRPRPRLHDCCCGPGTLALAIASERPDWEVSASDISEDAARFFAENNERIRGGRVAYARADLMEGIDGPFEVIVSNPPYLTPGETAERTALGWREPVLALDGGGEDGLDLIRRLIPRVFDRLVPGGFLLIEADPLQMPIIGEILIDDGFGEIRIRRDLAARERVVLARKSGGS